MFERYVIFYGGPLREFDVKDADKFADDLSTMASFFVAKDENGVAQGISEDGISFFFIIILFSSFNDNYKCSCNEICNKTTEDDSSFTLHLF